MYNKEECKIQSCVNMQFLETGGCLPSVGFKKQ